MALILHQVWWDGFEVRSLHFVVVVAALWVLARPSSVARLAMMFGSEVVAVGHDLPYVGDHTLLVFVTGLCVLAHLGWTVVRTRRAPPPGELFDALAPFLRIQLIGVYAAAAVAKLNTGFVDPQTSCAATMSAKIIWFDPSLLRGTWQVTPSIWATILIEFALPVLLAVPRTRAAALAIGCVFHVVLAFAGNVPFSALALALYVAFLPRQTVVELRASPRIPGWLRTVVRSARTRSASRVFIASTVSVWLVGALLVPDGPGFASQVLGSAARLTIVAMVAVAALLAVSRQHVDGVAATYPGSGRWWGHPIFTVGVALLVVNAASPYLGLKSESTFTMFSNLRTEQGTWNHLLIPESVRLFTFQDDLVTVADTDDPALRARTHGGTRLTRFESDRFLRSHPGAPGETIAQKLFHFKDVRPPDQGDCG